MPKFDDYKKYWLKNLKSSSIFNTFDKNLSISQLCSSNSKILESLKK